MPTIFQLSDVHDYDLESFRDYDAEDTEARVLTLEEATIDFDVLGSAPFGAIIDPDGKPWVLRNQFYHGVVLALLYPEELALVGGEPPRSNASGFKYQKFQFIIQHFIPHAILASQYGGWALTKPNNRPLTEAQQTTVLKILLREGCTGKTKISVGNLCAGGQVCVKSLPEWMNSPSAFNSYLQDTDDDLGNYDGIEEDDDE